MARVLIVSPMPALPTTTGNQVRIRGLAQAIEARGHELHFLHVERRAGDAAGMRRLWGERFHTAPYHLRHSPLLRRAKRLLRRLGLDAGYRFGIDAWYDPALDPVLARLRDAIGFDAVIVEYVFLSRALLNFPATTRRIIDTHDVFTNRHRLYLDEGNTPTWFSCSAREEARGLERADTVIAIQQREAERFRALTHRPVITVGHVVQVADAPPAPPASKRVLMVGSNNSINVDSLRWFVDQVLPGVRCAHPDATLVVAGSLCESLSPAPGLDLLGEVEDLWPVYADAWVVVNPMRFGTGLKIKSIEALGRGKALVTTPAGADGLDAERDAFRIATDANAFAREISSLLANPAAARALGAAAIELAHDYNRACIDELDKLLAD